MAVAEENKKNTPADKQLAERVTKLSTLTNNREREAINESSGRDLNAWLAREHKTA